MKILKYSGWSGGGITVALLVLWAASCMPASRGRYAGGVAGADKPALHAVHSDRLTEIMHEMSRVAVAREPQDTRGSSRQRARIDEAGEVAAALATTAQHIPDVLTDVKMDDEHRDGFLRLAEQLRDRAMAVQKHARENDLDQLTASWQSMTATCDACHGAFRTLPPVAEPAW